MDKNIDFKDKNLYFRSMNIFRKFLFPFSLLYAAITSIRNFLYDYGFFKSFSFEIPIIAVGNLSVGGTGKTPHVELLISILQNNYQVAVLSRGYKRESKGFVLANNFSLAKTIGDEPFQYFEKFKKIQVAVDADRKSGIENLLALPKKPNLILLDDAFQHRRVKAGLYVLLTTFDELYCNDFVLPMGNLRETKAGAKRANIVVITKCPNDLSAVQKTEIVQKLKLQSYQKLFFSQVVYDDFVFGQNQNIMFERLKTETKTIVAGIAKPSFFVDYVKSESDLVLIFPDHHDFSNDDLKNIRAKANGKKIITTEKDFMRLKDSFLNENLFYLPIKSKIIDNENQFEKQILDFVENFKN
jgi:tetraacyldisaccharide 4'-kinase